MAATQRNVPARDSPAPTLRVPPTTEAPKESAISRLLLAPLAFLSFLLSLALIALENDISRSRSSNTFFGKLKTFVYGSGNPYAYVRSPDARGDVKEREEPWHWHSKQRHLMKAEMEDAFRVRKRVGVVLVLALMGVGWGVKRVVVFLVAWGAAIGAKEVVEEVGRGEL